MMAYNPVNSVTSNKHGIIRELQTSLQCVRGELKPTVRFTNLIHHNKEGNLRLMSLDNKRTPGQPHRRVAVIREQQ